MSDTNVTVVGTATRDPELRFVPNGSAVANFGVAVSRRRKTDTGWEDGDPEFYEITAWKTLAENVAESVEKGTRVVVTGRLSYQTWEDKETGKNRSKVGITADEIGPSLRWATAEVTRTARSDRSVAEAKATVQEAFDPGSEPF
jgi:single-strand DNA-binding protein